MKPGNRSKTSDWVAALRALYSEAPPDLALFDDGVAERLLPKGLGMLVRGATRVPFGTRAVHRLVGALTFGLSYGVPLRTAAIDAAVAGAVERGVDQLVLLGAGLDARAFRMPALAHVDVFELDHPDTQAYKRARVDGLSALARAVHFCAIDFERQTVAEALVPAGFDPKRRSIWIWEGVTMYLSLEAIDATLDALRELAAPGSWLIVTYLPRRYANGWLRAVGALGAALIGEDLRSQQDPGELAARVERSGFRVESDDSAVEWAERWPARDAARVRPYERLAVCVRVA
jgi:methyltransferase (TIGR00027 family)